jgi:cytidylate kinase
MNVLIFGDQTASNKPYLKRLNYVNGNALLQTFLEQAAATIRAEVHRLPRTKRDNIPDFRNILELLEAYDDNDRPARHAPLDGALVAVTQLAHYIG